MSGLEISHLSNQLLKDVDLHVAPGACLTVAGPSGSGKSQLLRSIADLDPHEGEISIDGQDSQGVTGPQWRRLVTMVPAESQWWYDTVGEHFPPEVDVDFTALGFTEQVRDWQIDRLSTGERQRLALLRALAIKPRALLLDEPTAALDVASRKAVEALIEQFRREYGVPVIWVSHDEAQIGRISDQHMVIREGRLQQEPVSS